ncbi:MAG: hypothetical protein J6K69_07015 [Candidatus Methanomethylophilaceae archaeon]|nr:hypothetical protein [Candidatus Methanomethylophilaceae archaeon]
MIYRDRVKGTQDLRPQNIEVNEDTVYIRGNIDLISEVENGIEEWLWLYDEVEMSRAEYDRFKDLQSIVPAGQWTAGLQEAGRSVRYQRMDGRRAKCERMIRLGIDTDVHTEHLRLIDEYCEAVRQTQYAQGYPTNDPVWPEEPDMN